jgi:hypothetical protein
MQLSSGYSYAMTKSYPILTTVYLLFAFGLICIHVYYAKLLKKINNDIFCLFIFSLVILFFSFKHGFVRADSHLINYFTVVAFVEGLLFLFSMQYLEKIISLFKITVFISFVCIMSITGIYSIFNNNFRNIYTVYKLKENYTTFQERKIANIRSDMLPQEWNSIIGNDSIQVLPDELLYAEANQWNGWRPNPVLQLYSTYTNKLDEYSARSFTDERRPHFILLEYNVIDGRNMFLDTPATWNAIYPKYKVRMFDEKRLLLELANEENVLPLIIVNSKKYKFNEVIEIPQLDKNMYAEIKIELTIFGKIIATLYKGSPPQISVTYKNGTINNFRLITDTLQAPTHISYLPNNFHQTRNYFMCEGLEDFAVKEIKIINKMHALYYKEDIEVKWLYVEY